MEDESHCFVTKRMFEGSLWYLKNMVPIYAFSPRSLLLPSSRLGLLRRRRRASNPYFRDRRPSNPFDDDDAPRAPPAELFERIPRFDLYGPHNCGGHVHSNSSFSSAFDTDDSDGEEF